jgi:DNA-directed RNA polymerase specialized sigma24 family protein
MKSDPLRRTLRLAWSRIPARERVVFALLYFEGLTTVEAARALGCPVRDVERTVEHRLSTLIALGFGSRPLEEREPRRKAA